MNRFARCCAALIALGYALTSGPAAAQQSSLKRQILGTWTMVSVVDVYDNGKTVDDWGPSVKGSASFDASGRFTYMIIGEKVQVQPGSPRVSGRMVIAYYGSYSVDEAAKSISYIVERATYPEIDGATRKASLTIKGDEMVQNSTALKTPRGSITPRVVFKRAK